MGLDKSLTEIAESMLSAARTHANDPAALSVVLVTTAAELRGMAKALMGEGVKILRGGAIPEDEQLKVRLQAQEEKRRAASAESNASRMAEVVDGPAGESWVQIHPQMPEGGYTGLGGQRYQLRDGKLYHAPQEVKK